MAASPPELHSAVLAGHIRRGMSREQVAIALGYPIISESPRLDASTGRYWRSMSDQFQVLFGADGLAAEVVGGTLVKRAVFEE